MDIATIGGLVLAWVAVLGAAIMEGLELTALIAPSAAFLVILGTIGATMIGFSLQEMLRIPALVAKAMFPKSSDAHEVVKLLSDFAEMARRDGLLILDEKVKEINDPFLRKGIRLVVDGTDPELVKDMLETELALHAHKAGREASIFKTAGGFSPTLGIIGTVVGLVHVLGNLSEPDKLGEAIATAFIATFYGVSLANLVYLPLAAKLEARNKEELLIRQMVVEGVLSIQRGDNPRIVEEKLRVFLHDSAPAPKAEGGESAA